MPRLSFLATLLCLLGCTLAVAPPETVYRYDTRSSSTFKGNGVLSYAHPGKPGADSISIIHHVTRQYPQGKRQGQDPWISTSATIDLPTAWAQEGKTGCILHIDTTGMADQYVDVEEAFAKENMNNRNVKIEKEFAIKYKIPWTSIKGWNPVSGGRRGKFKANPDYTGSGAAVASGSGSAAGPGTETETETAPPPATGEDSSTECKRGLGRSKCRPKKPTKQATDKGTQKAPAPGGGKAATSGSTKKTGPAPANRATSEVPKKKKIGSKRTRRSRV